MHYSYPLTAKTENILIALLTKPVFMQRLGVHLDPDFISDPETRAIVEAAQALASRAGSAAVSAAGLHVELAAFTSIAKGAVLDTVAVRLDKALHELAHVSDVKGLLDQFAAMVRQGRQEREIDKLIKAPRTAPETVAKAFASISTIGGPQIESLTSPDARAAILSTPKRQIISTNNRELDALLGGGYHTGLWLVAAGTGVGKTATLATLAAAELLRGGRVVIATMEIPRTEYLQRIASGVYGPAPDSLRALLDSDHVSRLGLIDYCSEPLHSIAELHSHVTQLTHGETIDLLVVDYPDLILGDGKREDHKWLEHLYRDLSRLTLGDTPLARSLWTATQMTGANIAGAKAKAHTCDGVISVTRNKNSDGGNTFRIVKNRHAAHVTIPISIPYGRGTFWPFNSLDSHDVVVEEYPFH